MTCVSGERLAAAIASRRPELWDTNSRLAERIEMRIKDAQTHQQGCHLNRETRVVIERAGFDFDRIDEFRERRIPLAVVQPHLIGVAHKRNSLIEHGSTQRDRSRPAVVSARPGTSLQVMAAQEYKPHVARYSEQRPAHPEGATDR